MADAEDSAGMVATDQRLHVRTGNFLVRRALCGAGRIVATMHVRFNEAGPFACADCAQELAYSAVA